MSKGELSSLSLKVCNINQVMQTYVEQYYGMVGSTIVLSIVSKGSGSTYLLAAAVSYDIMGCVSDSSWVTWTLGAPNPLHKRFPKDRYIANHCNWVSRFNQANNIECGIFISGSTITCNGTLTRCDELHNGLRYGGYPGMGKGNVRLV